MRLCFPPLLGQTPTYCNFIRSTTKFHPTNRFAASAQHRAVWDQPQGPSGSAVDQLKAVVQAGTAAVNTCMPSKLSLGLMLTGRQCKEDHLVRPAHCHNTEVELEDGALVAAMHKKYDQ
jgi:hypothetical protein